MNMKMGEHSSIYIISIGLWQGKVLTAMKGHVKIRTKVLEGGVALTKAAEYP